jgi:hypothetical protein
MEYVLGALLLDPLLVRSRSLVRRVAEGLLLSEASTGLSKFLGVPQGHDSCGSAGATAD